MSRYRLWALVVLALALAGRPVSAQTTISYQFANSTGVAQTSFTVAPGAQIPVRLYMIESTANAPLMTAHGGMGTASVGVSFGTGAIAAVQSLTDIQPSAGPSAIAGRTLFDFPVPGLDPNPTAPTSARLSNGKFLGNTVGSPPGVVPADFAETQRVLIGTFVFTGKSAGSVSLVASDPFPTTGGTSGNFDGFDLDPFIASGATATLTVTAVPEPGSFALAGVGIAGLVAYRRRRKA